MSAGTGIGSGARATNAPAATTRRSVIESLGVYLPPRVVTTEEILAGTRRPILFPLERLTGIRSRRMAGETEFALDLARKAVRDCLGMSKYGPEDIDLLICASISRYDGPDFQFSFEPNTALKLKAHVGFPNAQAFDISNACAGMFTALAIVDALIRSGVIRVGMVVSGEYITHLTRTAQMEIDGIMDTRLPCLTLGDAGAAVILEGSSDDAIGFHALDMYTVSAQHRLCIAKPTELAHGGAIMYTEMMTGAAALNEQRLEHVLQVLQECGRPLDQFQHFLTHQTSRTTLAGLARSINTALNRRFLHDGNLIDNLAERGNTATTTHFVAIHDLARSGRIKSGDDVLLGISGSGSTLGVGVYTFDDLPDRIRAYKETGRGPDKARLDRREPRPSPRLVRVRIESIGTVPEGASPARESVELIKAAAEDCLRRSSYDRSEIGLLINTGVHRSEFIMEPAIAAIAAGELHINDAVSAPDEPRTFVFDLFNGATGFLDACSVAARMIAAGKYDTAMIVASEIENSRDVPGKPLRGIREMGSAIMLDRAPESDTGFGDFVFRYFTEHIGAFSSHVAQEHGKSFLRMHGDPHQYLHDRFLECIPPVVQELLERRGLGPAQIALVIPPQISSAFIDRLRERVAIPHAPWVDVAGAGPDLHTSSVPYALRHALDHGLANPGDVALIIAAAPGVQVACATYHF